MYCAEGLGSGINSKQNRYTAKGNIDKLEEYIQNNRKAHIAEESVWKQCKRTWSAFRVFASKVMTFTELCTDLQ